MVVIMDATTTGTTTMSTISIITRRNETTPIALPFSPSLDG